MSMPMNNFNQGGYAPPGFGSGYPATPPNTHQVHETQPGFHPIIAPGGYSPVPQMPPYNPNQMQYGQPQQPAPVLPAQPYGPQPPYGGHQPGFAAYDPQPIITQPTVPPQATGDWMPISAVVPNCPRGLEYLLSVDQLLVKQKVELLEAITGFETNNKFSIKNNLGQKVYFAVEDNDCCTRNCCGPLRPFDMKIFDNYKNEVIHMNRPLACDSCCFPCCLQSIEVTAPPGNLIGSIEQEWSILTPQFRVKNELGDVVFRIEGPFCTFSICGDVEFKIVSLNGNKIGKISKQWSGLARELFTDSDFFGLTFPMDLDVRMKAVLLGATFLIDAMFFEKQGNRESDRPGMF